MPTVLRLGGLRVVIYPNDHSPPHVHVIGLRGSQRPDPHAETRGRDLQEMAAGSRVNRGYLED